jgi:galactokinase
MTSSAEDVVSLFARTFGGQPAIVASAPGRVNLIGEHTDYNGGEVLPIGIAQRTWVAIRVAPGQSTSKAVSANVRTVGEWNAKDPTPEGDWWDYVSGVSLALAPLGLELAPLEIAVASDVPAGAGLSSSAALEVATVFGLGALGALDLPPREAALLGHQVESEYVGVPVGIMDQFASALAESNHALHLYCDSGRTEQVAMHEAVLIFDTGVPRSLRRSDFATRRMECEQALALLRRSNPGLGFLAHATPSEVRAAKLPPPLDRRALHVTEETRRVQDVVRALRATGTIPGELLYESHESLRDLYECSSPELDWFVHRASLASGVRGARLTGAGWGGCAIALGAADALADLAPAIVDDYRSRFSFTPRTWITSAAPGARIDSISR